MKFKNWWFLSLILCVLLSEISALPAKEVAIDQSDDVDEDNDGNDVIEDQSNNEGDEDDEGDEIIDDDENDESDGENVDNEDDNDANDEDDNDSNEDYNDPNDEDDDDLSDYVHLFEVDRGDEDDDDDDENFDDLQRNEPWKSSWKFQRGWKQYPLFIIILGGFRWDFVKDKMEDLPSFAYLTEHGTTMEKITPIFPPEDYPIWTSLATGLYPEDHGILGDLMYDLKTRDFFNKSDPDHSESKWWKNVDPFWSIASEKNRKVAMHNWHNCQLSGKSPLQKAKDCHPYKASPGIYSKQKIAVSFNEAFTKIHTKNYQVSVVYTDAIRRVVEEYGTNSPEFDLVLNDIDDILHAKLIDVQSKKERSGLDMNFMVLGDYGVTDTTEITKIPITDVVSPDDVQYILYASGYAVVIPYSNRHEKILTECEEIKGIHCYLTSHIQNPPIVYSKILPERFHYGEGDYMQDIVILAEPAFGLINDEEDEDDKILRVEKSTLKNGGSGWDANPVKPYFKKLAKGAKWADASEEFNKSYIAHENYQTYKDDMKTVGFAMGPDFKKKYVLKDDVETVDFYQLICFLLRIPPNYNSGSWERIEAMLTVSSSIHIIPSSLIISILAFILYNL